MRRVRSSQRPFSTSSRRKVVLPLPFGPTSATRSPHAIERLASRKSGLPWKPFV